MSDTPTANMNPRRLWIVVGGTILESCIQYRGIRGWRTEYTGLGTAQCEAGSVGGDWWGIVGGKEE